MKSAIAAISWEMSHMHMLWKRLHPLVVVVLMSTIAGCVSAAESRQSSYDRSRIWVTETEVQRYRDALDLVSNLRPHWLERRGTDSFRTDEPILVYRNSQRLGGVAVLRGLEVAELRELRFLNATEATQRFGTGHRSGVIMVVGR
jgi:hypothetical protein